MCTMIHTIYWAFHRWQALCTISAVACEPLVSARYCAQCLICILSFTAQTAQEMNVCTILILHLRKLGLRKSDELAQSNTACRWQSWGLSCSQPNSQIFKHCIWYLLAIWHLFCLSANVYRPQVCMSRLRDLPSAPGNKEKHMTHAQSSCWPRQSVFLWVNIYLCSLLTLSINP